MDKKERFPRRYSVLSVYLSVYYLNFEKALMLKNEELKQLEEAQRLEQKRVEMEKTKERMKSNAHQLIAEIKRHKDNGWDFYTFPKQYAHLYYLDRDYFNKKFAFNTYKRKGKTLLNHYIASAKESEHSFIQYLLSDRILNIDINLANDDGTTSFQEVYKSIFPYKGELIRLLFERDYQLTEEDRVFFIQWTKRKEKIK